MSKKVKTRITTELAAGSVASPFFYEAVLTQTLCHKTCADATPVFAPAFSFVSTQNVGTDQYLINLHIEGVIHYIPCGGNQCCVKAEAISEDFALPYYATAAPTSVIVTAGATENAINAEPCKECSDTFVSKTPLTITIA